VSEMLHQCHGHDGWLYDLPELWRLQMRLMLSNKSSIDR
jgi:hypothetical protein